MNHGKCIISGYVNGQKFRPSNWSERLCETGAIFDPLKRVMRYSEHLYPRQCAAYGCSVYVNFAALEAETVAYINWFIKSNQLELVILSSGKPVEVVAEVDAPVATVLDVAAKPQKSSSALGVRRSQVAA